jgi:mono/diheme cytochrome c family protein
MKHRTIGWFLFTAMAAAPAAAQDVGDASRGLDFALRTCAECHGVRLEETTSPRAESPPFGSIAKTKGMTGLALKVWFQTPHPSMPNLILSPDDRDDVIAYILSLRQ